MNTHTHLTETNTRTSSNALTALNLFARFWFVIAILGQWIFASYVAAFYGGAVVQGDLADWNKVLPHGYVPGEPIGNLAVGIHLLLAVIIFVGGPLQFVPFLRKRYPRLHRLNGKIYLVNAIVLAIGGLYMVWTRGVLGGLIMHISISINALLIILFALLAWRYAMVRQFDTHWRWVLRLFMVVSGVWFFRVGLMLWLMIHQAPVGFDPETFQGPFLIFLGFGQYLLPLAVLELYFLAKTRGTTIGRYAMGAFLGILTIGMAAGIFAAGMGMWLPRL